MPLNDTLLQYAIFEEIIIKYNLVLLISAGTAQLLLKIQADLIFNIINKKKISKV